jgi:hypothetical protein
MSGSVFPHFLFLLCILISIEFILHIFRYTFQLLFFSAVLSLSLVLSRIIQNSLLFSFNASISLSRNFFAFFGLTRFHLHSFSLSEWSIDIMLLCACAHFDTRHYFCCVVCVLCERRRIPLAGRIYGADLGRCVWSRGLRATADRCRRWHGGQRRSASICCCAFSFVLLFLHCISCLLEMNVSNDMLGFHILSPFYCDHSLRTVFHDHRFSFCHVAHTVLCLRR